MTIRKHPLLYQVNTRIFLKNLSDQLGHHATLENIPDNQLDQWAEQGFDWIWLLGVWQTGTAGQIVSRNLAQNRKSFKELLPDLQDNDITGSCFSISNYVVHSDFGGNTALAKLRTRMHKRGLRLMLDFVPNHTAPDHPWTTDAPAFYIQGSEENLVAKPQNYIRMNNHIFAYGRDPYFDGWSDTLQLNYGNPDVQIAMSNELLNIASLCEGVRCDMAMLIEEDIFEKTWGQRPEPFWPDAINAVKKKHPEFCFMAEVYWDREWALQQQGFDYTYDKRLYDRLLQHNSRPIYEHLTAVLDFQNKLARFLENHDELRAAEAIPPERYKAAAVITYCTPGLRFFHQGQLEGYTKHISVHLGRGPKEATDHEFRSFYKKLLSVLKNKALHEGSWQIIRDNPIVFSWTYSDQTAVVAIINYSTELVSASIPVKRDTEFSDLLKSSPKYKQSKGHLQIVLEPFEAHLLG